MAGNLARGNDLNIGQGKGLKIITLLGLVFLLLPLIVLMVFSFNEGRTVTHWTGFSLKWYATAFQDVGLWISVRNSLVIAIVSTAFTIILGIMGAILLARYKFRGKELFENLIYIPAILPEILFGVALLALFMLIGFPLGILSVICAHITLSFPFATMVILARVINLPPSLGEASLDLGANRWQTFVKIILPNIAPGVISGAVFAFTLSMDDFVVTFFTAGVGSSTLPLKIYSLIKFGITPSINAISTLLIIFTFSALYITNVIQRNERIGRKFRLALSAFGVVIVGFLLISPFISGKGKKLNIYNYSSYLDEEVIRDFEKQTGIDVTLDYYNDNEELLSRLQMGVSGYDLVFPSNHMVKILQGKELLAKINYRNIPNYSFISKEFRHMPYDSTGSYSIPYAYGYTGIVYNSAKVNGETDSWKILWDPRYKGKMTMVDDVRNVFYAAYSLLGYHMDADTSKLFQARELLKKQKPLLKKYESNAIEDLMLSEDVWIAHAWNGQIARLNAVNPKFKGIMPKEGTQFYIDNFCIPSNAPDKDNAELFINFLLKPENSAKNIKKIAYAMPNDEARKLLPPELSANPLIFPEIRDISKIDLDVDLGSFNNKLNKAWTELKVY